MLQYYTEITPVGYCQVPFKDFGMIQQKQKWSLILLYLVPHLEITNMPKFECWILNIPWDLFWFVFMIFLTANIFAKVKISLGVKNVNSFLCFFHYKRLQIFAKFSMPPYVYSRPYFFFFLSNVSCPMFIPCPTSIPDSRV